MELLASRLVKDWKSTKLNLPSVFHSIEDNQLKKHYHWNLHNFGQNDAKRMPMYPRGYTKCA